MEEIRREERGETLEEIRDEMRWYCHHIPV
jgi:hypothetical protein